MKKIILIIFFTLVLTDPFKALDKSFLYQEAEEKKEEFSSERLLLLKNECMMTLKQNKTNQLITEHLRANPNDISTLCDCLVQAQNISKKDLKAIGESLHQFFLQIFLRLNINKLKSAGAD